MVKAFSIALFCLITASGFAQSITWSESERLERGDKQVAMHALSDSTFLFRHVRNDGDELFRLDHYNTALQLVGSHTALWPTALPDGSDFIELYPCGKQWLALFEHTDKKANRHSLFGQVMTLEGTWIGEAKQLVKVDFEKWNSKAFDIVQSADSTHYLAMLNGPFNKDKSEEVHLAVFDQFLAPTWEKHLVLPYSDDQLFLSSAVLDADGNAHLYAAQPRPKVMVEVPASSDKKKNHTLFSYYPQTNALKEVGIDIGTLWITDAALSLSPEGHVGVAGLYSSGPYEQTLGVFHLILDAQSRTPLARSLTALPDSVVRVFTKGREIPSLYLDHVRFFSDRSVELVAEQFEVVQRITTDPATGRQVINYSYRYEDLLVARINVAGQVDAHFVAKSQGITSDHEMYSGYACIPLNNRTVLLFNDHPDNANASDHSRSTLTGIRKVAVAQVDINPLASPTRTHIDFQDADDPNFRPEICLLPGNRVVVYSQFKRNFRLGILEF